MRKSITIAAMLVVGAGATGVSAALPTPYQGSDTLFNATRQAITNSKNASIAGVIPGTVLDPTMGPATAYIGGGSGNGQAAMALATPTQATAPMSRMIDSGGNACTFQGGTAGSKDNHASGVVIGLDAVDVLASKQNGAQQIATCNLLPNGLSQSGNTVINSANQTWKWVLAEIYGGKDLSGTAAADCNSTLRQNIVANYQNFIQGQTCAANATPVPGMSGVSAASVCGAGTTQNGRLWHAFRRDEASGTSDVFASILGLTPAPSISTHNGFGDSPYCNAMNWDLRSSSGVPCLTNADCSGVSSDATCDTAGVNHTPSAVCFSGATPILSCSTNGTTCTTAGAACGVGGTCGTDCSALPAGLGGACGTGGTCKAQCQINENCDLGGAKQWVGPGGVSVGGGDTLHRQPPPGTWGNAPASGSTNSFDVLPTQMQDNDPIRRHCLGGAVNGCLRAGEEVCNMDGTLGLVLPMVDSDWMLILPTPLRQYPTNNCNDFVAGNAVKVLTCPIKNASKHSGECPNGDDLIGGACSVPFDLPGNTSQCVSTKPTVPPLQVRNVNLSDGRHYNVQQRDGTTVAPVVGYAQYPNPVAGNQDMAGAYNRIHQVETALGNSAVVGCQMVDMTDQIGCLVASDPCSIGYAGEASRTWGQRPNGGNCAAADPPICSVGGAACSPVGSVCNTTGTCILPWDVDAMNVTGAAAGIAGVQLFGKAHEYQFSRKLYFNTLPGFDVIPATGDEFKLGQNEAVHAFEDPILTALGFFPTAINPLCEDFNERTICSQTLGNTNACLANPAPAYPGAAFNTVCGNGIVEVFEECDPGAPAIGSLPAIPPAGAGAGGCSLTCRCGGDFNVPTGGCL